MAEIEPKQPYRPEGTGGPQRKALRYGLPVAVAGLVAATGGLVPALAGTGTPDLPKVTAEEVVAKMAASDVQRLSGTVELRTDLGLPELPGVAGGEAAGGSFGSPHGDRGHGDGGGEASDPQSKLMSLASGEHTLRVAADGHEKQRISVIEKAAEYSVIRNGDEVWAYDSANDSAYHAEAPAKKHEPAKKGFGELRDVTPQEAAKRALEAVDGSTSVSVDGAVRVAGRDAHQLVIEPKNAPHSTVGSVRVAVDAKTGTPLQFTLTPKGGGKPAVDVAYTDVDFTAPDADTFEFAPPKGTDVTEADEAKKSGKHAEKKGMPQGKELAERTTMSGRGWEGVAVIQNAGDVHGSAAAGGEGKVQGDFGTGRFVGSRLLNALVTDDGTVYVGAVTKEGLLKAADAAE